MIFPAQTHPDVYSQSSGSSLTKRIQQFYDESSSLWEQVWGEHMHHGYYGPDAQTNSPQEAQRILIERILAWSDEVMSGGEAHTMLKDLMPQNLMPQNLMSQDLMSRPQSQLHPQFLLDVGCGIGGSTLYLASKYRAEAVGITLSPVQVERATHRATAAGLSKHVKFQVADALAMPFTDQTFDLVWSLESGEHMSDKETFLRECCRVLKPGGRLIMATWCHRMPTPLLSTQEHHHLEQIYRLYHLPYVIALSDYEAIAQTLPLQDVYTADWSDRVSPFWQDVVQSALNPQVLWGILSAGWKTIEGAMAIPLMIEGYRTGLIRYGLLTGVKQDRN